MRLRVCVAGVFVFAVLALLGGCGKGAQPPSPSQEAPGPAAPEAAGPKHGGVLRAVRGTFPKVLGYPPEHSPEDNTMSMAITEKLLGWDRQGNYVPILAESWDVDPENKTITWHLRKGVKFHDGTDWNAEALKWNYQLRLDTNTLPDGKYVKSLEVVDEYTLRMHLTEYNRMLLENYGWIQMISPTAFESAGGGDREKAKEWARLHPVGTGPFKLAQYQRDTLIRFEKNPNYWRQGTPYLDAIEVRYVPDVMTAFAMMQAGEADMWMSTSAVDQVVQLEKMGFKVNRSPGFFWAILPNSNDPKSPFADKRVREAIEYALDREKIAEMVGHGQYEPLHQMAASDYPGYVPNYYPRPYNPEKAKQLLAEAGYPNGFKTRILAQETARDAVTAIQGYLAAVGIQAEIDIADQARWYSQIFAQGWSDLAFSASGINPNGTDIFVHFGPQPMTYRSGNIKKSDEFLALCEEALHTYDDQQFVAKLKEVVKQASEDAMVIPVYRTPLVTITQPYVHSEYGLVHTVLWEPWRDWMEERR
ncbi:MAG: ABC transporter substrate-binding protein [Moorellales bacterium]